MADLVAVVLTVLSVGLAYALFIFAHHFHNAEVDDPDDMWVW